MERTAEEALSDLSGLIWFAAWKFKAGNAYTAEDLYQEGAERLLACLDSPEVSALPDDQFDKYFKTALFRRLAKISAKERTSPGDEIPETIPDDSETTKNLARREVLSLLEPEMTDQERLLLAAYLDVGDDSHGSSWRGVRRRLNWSRNRVEQTLNGVRAKVETRLEHP